MACRWVGCGVLLVALVAQGQQSPAPKSVPATAADAAADDLAPLKAKAKEKKSAAPRPAAEAAKSAPLPGTSPSPDPTPPTTRRISADGDRAPGSDEPAPSPTVEQVPEPTRQRRTLFLGVRGGPLIPFAFLRPGFEVSAEVEYRIPALDGRLRVALAVGFAQLSGRASRIVPGRGLETNFLQNVNAWPIELSGRVELLRTESQTLLCGAGYAASATQATFNALGSTTSKTAVGHAAVLLVGYRYSIGPGELGATVRGIFGAVWLGELGRLGSDHLNSLGITLSYSVGL